MESRNPALCNVHRMGECNCVLTTTCVLATLCVVLGTSVTVLCKAAWMSATPPRYSPTFLTAVIIGALNFLCCRPVLWLRYCCLYKFWNTLATINFKIMSVPPLHWHSCSSHLFLSPKFKLSSCHNYTLSNFCHSMLLICWNTSYNICLPSFLILHKSCFALHH